MNSEDDNYQNYLQAYDAVLAQWSVPYVSRMVPTRFGDTHVLISGHESNPPLILLHGYMFSSTMWYPNIEELSQRFRVYAIDIIGDMNKSRLTIRPETRKEYADWLLEVCRNFGLSQAGFLGISYGGMLTLNMALYHPNIVSRATILSPAASFVPLGQQFFLQAMKMKQSPTGIDDFLKWIFGPNHTPSVPFANQFKAAMLWGGHKNATPDNLVWPYIFSDTELKQIQAQIVLLFGEKEVLYNPKNAIERATALLPNVHARIMPNIGHVISMEQSGFINEVLAGKLI